MNRAKAPNSLVFWISWCAAIFLMLLVLPAPFNAFKPYWLGLLTIYWALEQPERMGLGFAFAIGLFGDFINSPILGEQALRLTIIAFVVLRIRPRLRFFPMLQQSLAVLALLLNDRIVLLMIRGFSATPALDWAFWLGPLTATLLWPWLFLLLDLVSSRRRIRDV